MIALLHSTPQRTIPRFSCLRMAVLALITLSCVLSISAEAAGQEIAILRSSDLSAYNDAIQGFKATAPGTASYVEFDLRGDLEQGRHLARRIRNSRVSLVVAVGLKAAQAAKLEIADIPVLYMMILDPLKHHLTADNMTGVLLDIPPHRQFKILRAFLPALQRIGMLYDPRKTASTLPDAEQQASIHNFQLQRFSVEHEKDLPPQLRMLLSASEALWLTPDSTVLTDDSLRFILESALTKQVPVIGFSPELTRLGALLSVSISYREVGRDTGLLAKRILNGEQLLPLQPIPVERVRLTVNLKTARYLGITIPREIESLIDETY